MKQTKAATCSHFGIGQPRLIQTPVMTMHATNAMPPMIEAAVSSALSASPLAARCYLYAFACATRAWPSLRRTFGPPLPAPCSDSGPWPVAFTVRA